MPSRLHSSDAAPPTSAEALQAGSSETCSAAGCGASGGICPGVALFFSLLVGSGLAALTGWDWLMPVCAILGTTLLSTGLYRRFNPFRLPTAHKENT